jgi:outer membrane immunogenic protein
MMRRYSFVLLAASVLSLAASQVTSAADLARRAPPPAPAYVPPAPLPYLWTGCYGGGNIGGAWSNFEVTDVATGGTVSTSNSGFAGGGQIGCDYQWNAWVFGFRNMFDGTSLSSSRAFADTSTHWFDTLTARGGYLVAPNVLLYVQGGAAWTNTKVTFFDVNGGQVGELTNDRTGWTVGGGAEWMFAPHWSVFAEYNFMGFGTRSDAFTTCGVVNCAVLSARANLQDVLVGLNYKF